MAKELWKYNPEKGLKTIAVSEAAEKHFARAKDAEKLYEAIETKLKAQAEFVLWWDGQKNKGRPTKKRNGPVTLSGKNGIPERMVLSRWRQLLDEAKLIRILDESRERCRSICEMEGVGGKIVRGTQGTGENEWHTPDEYLELARKVLGEIDLDPATHAAAQKRVRAKKFFTEKDDGLRQEWHGRVWLNPPYAQPLIAEFVNKMIDEYTLKHVSAAIMLTHNYTDTEWFQSAAKCATAICFTRGRIRFVNLDNELAAPTQGQAFFYFGNDTKTFNDIFGSVGFIVGRQS
jgi:phage N-6-adenine-methyltransferase